MLGVVSPPGDQAVRLVETAGVVEVLGVVPLEGRTKRTSVREPGGEDDLVIPGVTLHTSLRPGVRGVAVTLLGWR